MSEIKEIEVDTTSNQKNVVWIDQNNDEPENKRYLQICSEVLKNFSFTLVTSVKEGYECLSKFKFKLVYVILSGRLAEEFLDIYEENLHILHIRTLNINSSLRKNFEAFHKKYKYLVFEGGRPGLCRGVFNNLGAYALKLWEVQDPLNIKTP